MHTLLQGASWGGLDEGITVCVFTYKEDTHGSFINIQYFLLCRCVCACMHTLLLGVSWSDQDKAITVFVFTCEEDTHGSLINI